MKLPSNARFLLTGFGRVGHGAREILDLLPIKEVSPEEYLNEEFDEPVFTHLEVEDYYERKSDRGFDKSEFYTDPSGYRSTFSEYLPKTDMYIPCHYWSNKADFIVTRDNLKAEDSRLSVVADISCDIDGPVACTIRPSKIGDAIYGYDPEAESETDFQKDGVIAVMAVDNLPCELPKDASEDFGNELIKEELDNRLGEEFSFRNLDKVFQIILTAATYEFLYKPNISINIIIKEYLNSSNFFLEDSQTKYLNALLDNIGKKLRSKNA